jgi:uracil-DNA glycosylase family 4
MIIGKRPGLEEIRSKRNLVGDSGEELSRIFQNCGVDVSNYYVTNVVRFLPPDGGKKLRPGHIKDCLPLLAYELEIVRPEYILLLGADAVKFMYGKSAILKGLRGAELPFSLANLGKLPTAESSDNTETKVIATVNPAQVVHDPSLVQDFEEDIARFVALATGKRKTFVVAPGLGKGQEYQYLYKLEDLKKLVSELITGGFHRFAIDCEWAGEDCRSGQLRTIQFSWAPGKAAVVVMRKAGGEWVFDSDQLLIAEELRQLFSDPKTQLIGHNFRADAPWLEDIGIPVICQLWFDTMLADHLLNENADHTLVPGLSGRYTTIGRYDFDLHLWRKKNPAKVKKSLGYGLVPDHLLLPYGAADVDCTFQAHLALIDLLDLPGNKRLKDLFYRVVMPANQPIYEMEMNGILVDAERMVALLWKYVARKQELLAELRKAIYNEEFNPRSYAHKVKLLFGATEEGGLGLTPIKSTEKPARTWDRVMTLPPRDRARINPAVDMEVLELLAVDAPTEQMKNIVTLLLKFQIIDQVTKNFLKPPKGMTEEDADMAFERNLYVDGLLGHIDDDGRIRTRISQIKETGRYGSSNPNLQNISKRQEAKYSQIMGGEIASMRSCFIAPEGYVLIESDYKSAEVLGLAYTSGDKNLIADALGPVKLHAKVAVDVLMAPCSYAEVAELFPNLYVSAKNINFGIPYQRGAKAIARQINRETGGAANMTQEMAQELINAWYERYSGVRDYVNDVKRLVREAPHWIENAYGRRRRFYFSSDESIMAAQEREGVNFPIQSLVAEALSISLRNLWQYKKQNPWCNYDILLAIHDAVLLQVPVALIEHVIEFVLPACMKHGVTVPVLNFNFDIDPDIYLRWGEKPNAEDLEDWGVPEKYWPKKKVA